MNANQITLKKVIDNLVADSRNFACYDVEEFGIEAQGIVYNIKKDQAIIFTIDGNGKIEMKIKKISEMKPIGAIDGNPN